MKQPQEKGTSGSSTGELLLLLALVCSYLGAYVIGRYEPFAFTSADAGWLVTVVQSLAHDGDLDLRNQLHYAVAEASDQCSLGANGEWFSVHEWLMPLLTVPFYTLWDVNGCLIFNLTVATVSAILAYRLAMRCGSPPAAFAATIVVVFGSMLRDYSYGYSLDVFATLVLLAATLPLLAKDYFLGGLFVGLAVLGRLHLAAVVPIALLLALLARGWRAKGAALLALAAGGALPLAVLLYANAEMYGSPFTVAYERWLVPENEGLALVNQRQVLFTTPLFSGVAEMLFSRETGFLFGAPFAPIALLGLGRLWNRRREDCVFVVGAALALLALYSMAAGGLHPGQGNRYLLPVSLLLVLPLAELIRSVTERLNGHSPKGEQR